MCPRDPPSDTVVFWGGACLSAVGCVFACIAAGWIGCVSVVLVTLVMWVAAMAWRLR